MSKSAEEIRSIIDRLHDLKENNDGMDNAQLSKLMILANDGLVAEEDVRFVRSAMRTMDAGRLPSPQQRDVLMGMLGTLAELITSDMSMYQRIRTQMRKQDQPEDKE
jgi:hypothetical protein